MTTIGVIGAGAVGQAVGTLLVASGWCSEVMVCAARTSSADGLVTDLEDMVHVTASPVRVRRAGLQRMRTCDALVVCPRAQFTNTHRTDIRMAGLAANGAVVRDLARSFQGYEGPVVMVTNPVDVLSRLFADESGSGRVLGIGSSTDTARYRLTLADMLGVPATWISGHVIGEHGDHAVICTSSTTVHGQPVNVPVQQVRDELKARPGRITAGIGRIRSGPAGAVLTALSHTLGFTDGVMELSAPWGDVHLGIPLRYTGGQTTVCLPPLNQSETRELAAAEAKIHAAYTHLRSTLRETTAA